MVVRQVTREQLATLKATADALEHGNLDDPVSAHGFLKLLLHFCYHLLLHLCPPLPDTHRWPLIADLRRPLANHRPLAGLRSHAAAALRCVAAGLPRDGGPGAVQRQQRRRHRRCCGEARARAAPQQACLMTPEEEGYDT